MTLTLPHDAQSAADLRLPDLLAPAGNWECARAAVENGADAIYFGLDRFNARMRAENFTEADLPDLMAWLHRRGVRGYVTFNTLVFPTELPEAEQYLRSIIAAGVDAAIVQDVGLCRLIRALSPDFPIHASTQMTISSAAGVAFARELGCELAVLARENSIAEIGKIQHQTREQGISLPLEVFVHGALCVAYSGACLTSSSLGGRSANRGECAQACRMTYDLVVDGETLDLGDRRYLLSPQDLAGLEVLPELIAAGVSCLKIEGRLKAPEYVAAVTRVYRQALDRCRDEALGTPANIVEDHYDLEMAFSRGLHSGWFRGIDNQVLVHARYGKKRGVWLGEVLGVDRDRVRLRSDTAIRPGDGLLFQAGDRELGGRVYQVEPQPDGSLRIGFGPELPLRALRPGDPCWKTSDPDWEKRVRQTYSGDQIRYQRPVDLELYGAAGLPLTAIARDEAGHIARVDSDVPLETARNRPLTEDRLREQFGRLGGTPFRLGALVNQLEGELILPVSELNRLRRSLVDQLEQQRQAGQRWQLQPQPVLASLLPSPRPSAQAAPELVVLAHSLDQLLTLARLGCEQVYCEFEDPRQYRTAVERFRAEAATGAEIWVAPPRVHKPGETWILDQVRRSQADGYLVRNYDHLDYFRGDRRRGDFALNVANPLTAAYWMDRFGLEGLTISYDLDVRQVEALLAQTPPDWLELTLHQHMPMFHMEHCVFCTFLSEGHDFRDCGRPCESHAVKLRDRVGTEHVLMADAGCRNTLYNGTAQTGAEYAERLISLGLRRFRVEFLDETPDVVERTVARYRQLLAGDLRGDRLWKELKLQSQIGITRGTLAAE